MNCQVHAQTEAYSSALWLKREEHERQTTANERCPMCKQLALFGANANTFFSLAIGQKRPCLAGQIACVMLLASYANANRFFRVLWGEREGARMTQLAFFAGLLAVVSSDSLGAFCAAASGSEAHSTARSADGAGKSDMG